MAAVFEVHDREHDTRLALKVLELAHPEALVRFKREFRSMQGISHPNLVRLDELGEADGVWFYTMELIDGVDLLTWVGDDPQRLRHALRQLASALATLHAAGKVHRDVKPSNILVDPTGRVVLLDFGLILDEDGERITEEGVIGTGAYLAPEQTSPKTTGPPVDCYALGVVAYEALTGQLPFTGSVVQTLIKKHESVALPPSAHAVVPADLDELCIELLSAAPESRPTAVEIAQRLGDMAAPHHASAAASARHRARPRERFVGRRQELSELRAALRRTRAGGGANVVFIEGVSGLGKSALLERFRADAEIADADALFFTGKCYERESVPFKGIDGVIDALAAHLKRCDDDAVDALVPDDVVLLADVFPSLRRLDLRGEVLPYIDSLGPHQLRARAFEALRTVFARLAATRPVVLMVDDMQWANADTWHLLEHLMRPHSPRILLVLGGQPDDDVEAADARRQERFGTALVHRKLSALDRDDAVELARGLLRDVERPRGTAITIAEEADGHPLFIHELARHAVAGGDFTNMRLDEALSSRFATLAPTPRLVFELVVVAGIPLRLATISAAAEVELAELAQIVAVLRREHLLRSAGARAHDVVVHYHDRIRKAALASMDDETLAAHHHRLAQSLEDTGVAHDKPELVLHHAIAAGLTRRAARYAEEAARRAMRALAFGRASSLYRIALRIASEDAARRRLQLALAHTLVADGRGAEAADLFLAAGEDATPSDRIELWRQAAEHLLLSGHMRRGTEVLSRVLDAMGEPPPKTQRGVLASILWRRTKLRLRGLRWTPRDALEIPPRQLARLDVYRGVSVGLALVDNVRAVYYQCDHLRLALDLGERDRVIQAVAVEGVFLASQGAERRVRAVETKLAEWSASTQSSEARAYALFASIAIKFFIDNDWDAALTGIDEAETIMREFRAGGWEHDTLRMYRCFCLLYRGQLTELARVVPRFVRDCERRGDRYGSVSLRTRLPLPWLAANDPTGAERLIDKASAQWLGWEDAYLVQHFFALHSRCEIALYEQRASDAHDHLAEQQDPLRRSHLLRIPMVANEVEYLRGRIALGMVAAGSASHLAQARRSATSLARSRIPAPRAWASLLTAGIVHAQGGDAIPTLEHAATHLADRGDLLYASAALWLLGQLTGAPEATAQAAAWMDSQGVVRPVDFVRMLAGWHPEATG